MGRVTSSSISSGLAFSYEVLTLRVGNVMSGIRSMGSLDRETPPRMMTMRTTMMVKMGR